MTTSALAERAREGPVVWVVQEDPRKNVIAAGRFGEMRVVLDQFTQVSLAAAPVIRRMRTVMNDFQSGDYILAVGDPVAIGIACAIAVEKTGGHFNMLKWDRQERVYYPITVDLTGTLSIV